MKTAQNPRDDWMRPLSFAGLLRVVKAVAAHHGGLRAGELNSLVNEQRIYLTREGKPLAPTPLYHLRRALLHLGALTREGAYLQVNYSDPQVRALLDQAPPEGGNLTQEAKTAWANLVLRNPSARARFFDLFMPQVAHYDTQQFRSHGRPVVWRRDDPEQPDVRLTGAEPEQALQLSSALDFQSILYGVRYWARDELGLIDEFFRPGVGSIMYPITQAGDGHSPAEVARDIPQRSDPASDWTLLSLQELATICCEQRRRPLADLHATISWLARTHAGWVVLLPTSPRAATLTARSATREDYELRGLHRDDQGRYISHLRIHHKLFPVLAGA